jgi:hypothetical protein
LRTFNAAGRLNKPCVHISGASLSPAATLQRFVSENCIRVLNVAGKRESKEPGIHDWVMLVLEKAFVYLATTEASEVVG